MKTTLALIACSVLSAQAWADYRYTIYAPVTPADGSGVYVECLAAFPSPDSWRAWTVLLGNWTVEEIDSGVDTSYTQISYVGRLSISAPQKIDTLVVADYLFDGVSRWSVVGAVQQTVKMPPGVYWIDFDANHQIRLNHKRPSDFGVYE